jgi:primosomal protein N' (replication factor Y)
LGTEAVAEIIAENQPDWRLARLDRDTAGDPKQLGKILKQVADHEVDVIVGTQMISKGHHFPRISLVGVLLADQALSVPDFRAAERTFVLITQVAGRAGREGGPGRVIVQTYDPDHHAIQAALAHDPRQFYEQELEERKALGYPPFMRLLSLRLESARESAAKQAARHLAQNLDMAKAHWGLPGQVLGPAPAPVAKVSARYRFLILVKAQVPSVLGNILRLAVHRAGSLPGGVRLMVDVDPLTIN